jgi:hypothetical protein
MTIKKQFTKEQKHMLIQCIIDCDLFGLSDKEGMKYVEEKTGRAISLTSYQRYKKIALNDEAATSWINNFGKIGFVKHYRKRITEIEYLQKTTLIQLNLELDKNSEEQDKKYVVALMDCIRQTNIQLCQMGMGMPVLAKMKEILQGGTYNSRVLELNGLRDNPILPSSSSINEHINIDRDIEAEKKTEEERLRKGEEIFKKQMEKAVFFNPQYD